MVMILKLIFVIGKKINKNRNIQNFKYLKYVKYFFINYKNYNLIYYCYNLFFEHQL